MLDISSWTPEYILQHEADCQRHLDESSVRSSIPQLNNSSLDNLRDGTLVRFRGMIQDKQDPECYLERYEVRCKQTGSVKREQNGKYRDVLVVDSTCESVDPNAGTHSYGERQSMFVITIPGYNQWAVDHEKNDRVPKVPLQEQDGTSNGVKRSYDDEEEKDMDVDGESVVSKKLNTSDPAASGSGPSAASEKANSVLSPEYLLNSPLADRPSKACLVKLYADFDEWALNTVVDVIGFLSVDPALDGSNDVGMDEFEDEMTEHQATHPPPSLIPRIHAISVRKMKHTNPLLDEGCVSAGNRHGEVWRDLRNLLTQCLFGDTIAADYLLCHLISTVYIRNEVESRGQFSLNLSNIPQKVLPTYTQSLYEVIELLLPASHYFPMKLEHLNTLQFVPKKDYKTNKLTSGILQLAPHTHLVLDETQLETGKLESAGVEAVQSIAQLIKNQTLKYNFQYYSLDFNTDIPVLVLSEGRSMIPNNFHLPLIPDLDTVDLIDETIKAGKHYIRPKLDEVRKFLTTQRLAEFDMKSFDLEVIHSEFVELRKKWDASMDDLHALLVLTRLVGLSRGETQLSKETWEHASMLEQERMNRQQMFTKRTAASEP